MLSLMPNSHLRSQCDSTQLNCQWPLATVELSWVSNVDVNWPLSPALLFGAMLSGLTFSITRSVHSYYYLRITVIQLSPYHSCLHHSDTTLHYFLYKFALMWLEFLIAEYSYSNSKVIQTAWYLQSRFVKWSSDLRTSNFKFKFVFVFSPSIFESKHH